MSPAPSRRSREITQWTFVLLAVVAVVAYVAGAHPVALVVGIGAALALLVAVAQSLSTGFGRRGG